MVRILEQIANVTSDIPNRPALQITPEDGDPAAPRAKQAIT
jgi:hypothetical protein